MGRGSMMDEVGVGMKNRTDIMSGSLVSGDLELFDAMTN